MNNKNLQLNDLIPGRWYNVIDCQKQRLTSIRYSRQIAYGNYCQFYSYKGKSILLTPNSWKLCVKDDESNICDLVRNGKISLKQAEELKKNIKKEWWKNG